ncbi:putative ribonuclease H-like domain-containing protein, partial [Tanacetum coccineum]
TKACDDACKARMETIPDNDYILLPLWTVDLPFSQSSKSSPNAGFKPSEDDKKKVTEEPRKEGVDPSKEGERDDQENDDDDDVNSTNNVNAANTNEVNAVGVTPPKFRSQRNVFPGALLHDPIAQVRRERPLSERTLKVIQTLKIPSWIEAMQDELLQFKLQKRGKINKSLFIKRDKGDILLVQVYVDDIIFGSTKKSLCTEFEKMMHKKFQISSMGELTFFLGLQVKQKEDGIFISQDKHSNKKKLIQMIKIHTDKNVADLHTKAFNVKTVNGEQQLQALVDRKKIIITEATVRRDLQLEDADGIDCLPNATIFEQLTLMGRGMIVERLTTTATGLDSEQDRGNISKTQSKATPNEPSSIGTSSGGGPRRQDTMGDTITQPRVLDLENTKTAQAQEITSLKKRVKKLERKKKSRTHGLKRLYKVGLSARIDSSDDEASLGDQEDASKQGRKIHDIDDVNIALKECS